MLIKRNGGREEKKKINRFKKEITLILTSAASSSLEQNLSDPFDLNLIIIKKGGGGVD